MWLSPVQVKVIPISEKFSSYTQDVCTTLLDAGIRVEMDVRNEKVGYKIRDAEINKTPYMAIVGEKEINAKTVSVRQHTKGDRGVFSMEQFIDMLKKEITEKVI